MIDLRDYKGTIRMAVLRERHNDVNWAWKVCAISKEKASIEWTYLTEYLGERCYFEVRAYDDKDVGFFVEAKSPDGVKAIRFVGDSKWDDFDNVDDALSSAIHGIALHAHAVY